MSGDPDGCTTQTTDFGAILAGFAPFCCTVSGGACAINTTANAAIGSTAITAGDQINAQLLDCGLNRETGSGSPTRPYACALLVP